MLQMRWGTRPQRSLCLLCLQSLSQRQSAQRVIPQSMLVLLQFYNCAEVVHHVSAAHTATACRRMGGTDALSLHTTARPQGIICTHLALILFLQVLHLLLCRAQASLDLHQLARQAVLYGLLQLVQLGLHLTHCGPRHATHHLSLLIL